MLRPPDSGRFSIARPVMVVEIVGLLRLSVALGSSDVTCTVSPMRAGSRRTSNGVSRALRTWTSFC